MRMAFSFKASNTERVLAYVSIVIDEAFVVRDLRLIRANDKLFLAMPNREVTRPCRRCAAACGASHRFCNACGAQLEPQRVVRLDMVQPITAEFRQTLEKEVLAAFAQWQERPREIPSKNIYGETEI